MHPPVLLTMPDYCGTLAAARCLGQHGYPVWMVGDNARAPAMHSRHVTKTLRCPPLSNPQAFLEFLLAVGKANPGLVLYPTSDDLAWFLAAHQAELSKNFRTWAPDVKVYETLLDKHQLLAACARVGLGTPRTLSPTNEAELAEAVRLAPLPVLLKQRTQVLSKTNHKGVLVRDRERLADEWRAFRRDNRHSDALSAHLPNASEPLIQQYFLEGVSGSLQVSGFISRDGKLFVARAAKKLLQRPRTLGISLCLEATELDPALAEKIKALCLEVGYFGVFGIEFLQVKGRPLLIDFNPRYYHFMALDIARGMPLPLLTALAALGEDERLADAVAQAQHDPKKVDAFTYAFQFRELLLAQTLTGTMKAAESLRWWRWYRAHRHSMVDAVRDDDDRRPALVDGAWSAAMRVRHPLTFVMRVALDR